MKAIIRRLQKLEQLPVAQRAGPPFTSQEIQAIVERIRMGELLESDELERLRRSCPIMEGNLRIFADSTTVYVKRIIGVGFDSV